MSSPTRGPRFVRRITQRFAGPEVEGGDVWDAIQLARHQDRPYPLDYIGMLMPDFEEILDPLASSLPADQRASWRALRGTDLWWDHVGEPIFLAVDVEAEGALIEFLDLRWSTAAVEES